MDMEDKYDQFEEAMGNAPSDFNIGREMKEIAASLPEAGAKGERVYPLLSDAPSETLKPCEDCEWVSGKYSQSGIGSTYPCNGCRDDRWQYREDKD